MSLAPGRCRRLSAALGAAALLVLAACAPEPTPLPVVPVATTPAPEQTAETARTALAVDALSLRLLPAVARNRLNTQFDVQAEDIAPEGAGVSFSLLPFPGGMAQAYALPVALRLNTALTPLDDPAVAGTLQSFLAGGAQGTPDASALRVALANAGYPDGISLTLGLDPLLADLALPLPVGGPVRWILVPLADGAQAALAVGAEADSLVDAGGVWVGALPVYASAGWQVTADDSGLPVVAPVEGG